MGGNKYLILLIAYSVFIFLLSSIPGSDIPSSVSPHSLSLHFVLYLFYGIVTYLFFWNIRNSLIFASLYALSDELHQYFVPGRNCDIIDLLVDILGISVGVFILYIVRKKLLPERS